MGHKNRLTFLYLPLALVYSLPLEAASDIAEKLLPEIEVIESADAENPTSNYSGIKATVPAKDLPLVIETLSSQVLNNLHSQNLESLLDIHTSGSVSPSEGGTSASIILRGFSDASFYRNGLNHTQGTSPLRDIANIESVEILKGASSALYGPGEPGGTINITTKKPHIERAQSAELSVGSYQKIRAEIDSTGAFTASNKLAYRMIAAYEDTDSFRDRFKSNKVFVSPSISWIPNDNWRLLAEMEYVQHKAPYDTGLVAVEGTFPLPFSIFLGEPGLGQTRSQATTSSLSAEYRQADKWSLSAKLLWHNTDIDGSRTEPDELEEDSPGEFILSRSVQQESDNSDSFSAQLEFSTKFIHSGVQQQLLAGFEYISTDNHIDLNSSDPELDAFEINIFNPVYGQRSPALFEIRQSDELLQQHSLYIQDFISLSNKLKLLLGTRLDKIKVESKDAVFSTNVNQSDTELSSRAGLLYAIHSKLSMFASYSESTDPNEGLRPDGNPLKPSRGKSFEGGIRFNLPQGNLSVDASFYSIEQTNVAVDAPGAPGFEIQTARQKSEGVDLAISLNPVKRIKTSLSYVYTDAGIFDDPEIPDGTQPLNVPLHKLVFATYSSFNIKRPNDFQAGLSFTYRSKQKASLDPDELTVHLPDYWLGNLFINYDMSAKVSLGLNIHNLFDEKYLAASQSDLLHIRPGEPLTVMGSIKLKF